jgi:hypothetical protein
MSFSALDTIHFVSQSKTMKHLSLNKSVLKRGFVLAPLLLLLAAMVCVARAAEFQKASYSATLPNGAEIVLKFEDNGKFSLSHKDGKLLVAGTYKATKNQIEFTDEKGPIAAKDAKPGKYEWKLESDKLNFTVVQDGSEGRRNGLTRPIWTLQK